MVSGRASDVLAGLSVWRLARSMDSGALRLWVRS